MARPFGTTSHEEIKAAVERWLDTAPPMSSLWAASRSDLLNLLDALWDSAEKQDYLPDIPEAARWKAVARWARTTRIAILASLGLEEQS